MKKNKNKNNKNDKKMNQRRTIDEYLMMGKNSPEYKIAMESQYVFYEKTKSRQKKN